MACARVDHTEVLEQRQRRACHGTPSRELRAHASSTEESPLAPLEVGSVSRHGSSGGRSADLRRMGRRRPSAVCVTASALSAETTGLGQRFCAKSEPHGGRGPAPGRDVGPQEMRARASQRPRFVRGRGVWQERVRALRSACRARRVATDWEKKVTSALEGIAVMPLSAFFGWLAAGAGIQLHVRGAVDHAGACPVLLGSCSRWIADSGVIMACTLAMSLRSDQVCPPSTGRRHRYSSVPCAD